MKRSCRIAIAAVFATLASVALSLSTQAAVRLPAVLADHAVFQRDAVVPVWGWADARKRFTAALAGQTRTTTADEKGIWSVKLDPMRPSATRRELTVAGTSSTVKISDVLVGNVWLAGGQSNMDFRLNSACNAAEVSNNGSCFIS